MFHLRPYQEKAFDDIREQFRQGLKRVLLVSPTGSGKTVSSTHMIASAVDKGKDVLFIAHRREILFQTRRKLEDAGIDHGWIMSGMRKSAMAPVHLASIQTLTRRELPRVGLVIWDEAHRNVGATYRKIMEHYCDVHHVGLTATPCRSDGNGLGGVFESLVQAAQTSELVRDGYLVPAKIYAPSRPDLKKVKVKRGDYEETSLGEVMDKPKLIGDIVAHWEKHAAGQKTIVFAVNRSHAQHLTESFDNSGHRALYVDGETPHQKRMEIFREFETERNGVLVNVGICTEGYDNPATSCIVMARPTKSLGLFLQMAGRGMRPHEGKKELTILDHSGSALTHGYPDEDIVWRLDETLPAGVKKPKTEKTERGNWVCGQCFILNESHEEFCCGCGCKASPTSLSPAVGEGSLQEMRRKKPSTATTDEKAREWVACVYKASHNGLKIGAAYHMYKQKFGVSPHHSFDYLPKGKEEWNMLARIFIDRRRQKIMQRINT